MASERVERWRDRFQVEVVEADFQAEIDAALAPVVALVAAVEEYCRITQAMKERADGADENEEAEWWARFEPIEEAVHAALRAVLGEEP